MCNNIISVIEELLSIISKLWLAITTSPNDGKCGSIRSEFENGRKGSGDGPGPLYL